MRDLARERYLCVFRNITLVFSCAICKLCLYNLQILIQISTNNSLAANKHYFDEPELGLYTENYLTNFNSL